MKPIYFLLIANLIVACGGETLEDKKQKLGKLKSQAVTLNQKIQELETEIIQSDPNYNQLANQRTLISTLKIQPETFQHKIDVRGSVASRKNVLVSAETNGRIESINVREGDQVRKGQLLIAIDASILENSVEELKTALELATTVYNKRARLWEQKIGSEIQYLESKNQMETLQHKLATTRSQLRQSQVRAPFNGVIDDVQAKLGEMAMFGSPLLRILSVDDMHLEADVSEKYLGRLSKGDSVNLYFSSFELEFASKITSLGQVINPQNRTFSIEIALPPGEIKYKPNLVAIVEITDYLKNDAITIPSELVQQDSQGSFVYAVDGAADDLKAKKIHISTGKSYKAKTEILDGIEAGTVLVQAGHREVTDGALVQVATRESI